MAKTFGGTVISLPGVYTSADVSAFVAPVAGGTLNVGIVGPSIGGTLGKIYKFTSYQEAYKTLKGGELLDLIRLIFNPGGAQGAGLVYAVRVAGSGAAQASKAFGTLTLTAIDYGTIGNRIRVGISDGTAVGKKIIVQDTFTGTTETYDNLGPAFSVKYTGTGASCTLTITISNGQATTLSLTPKDDEENVITEEAIALDLTSPNYNTVGKVLEAISRLGVYQVTRSLYLTDTDLPSSYLEAVSNQDVKTSAYTVTATLGICITTINKSSKLVTARKTNATDTNPPTNTDFTFLTGGNDGGTPTSTDYANALNLLTTRDIQIVCVASGDSSVHSVVASHINDCSSITGKKERVAFLGLANPSATKADYIAAALPYSNSYRIVMCAPGIVENINGTLVQRPSYYTAALLAGLKAGLALKENITHKTVGVVGLTQEFTLSDITELMESGVTVVAPSEGDVFRVVKGVTTYRTDNNLAKQEISAVLIIDAISKDIRRILEERFLGRALSTTVANEIAYEVGSVLLRYADNGSLIGNPPYRNIQVTITNDAVYVSYEAHPATIANYIFVAQTFTPAFEWQ